MNRIRAIQASIIIGLSVLSLGIIGIWWKTEHYCASVRWEISQTTLPPGRPASATRYASMMTRVIGISSYAGGISIFSGNIPVPRAYPGVRLVDFDTYNQMMLSPNYYDEAHQGGDSGF